MGERALRAALVLAGAAALAAIALPLLPRLTPDWPRSPSVSVLVLGGLLALGGVVLAARHELTRRALLLAGAFPLYALYVGNGANLTSGDNAATRALPSTILTQRTLDLSKTPPFDPAHPSYSTVRVGTRLLNFFPSGTALVALPHAAVALLGSGGRVSPELVSRWEKHAAALMTVAAAALVWAAARRWGNGAALGAAAVFALATPVFANAAQALWSFTGEVLCLSLALFLSLRERPLPAWAGVASGAALACRPTALIGAAAIAAGIFFEDRRRAARYALAFAGAAIIVFAAQAALYGHSLGAYGAFNTGEEALNRRLLTGLAGVLLSPSRGLLVFCPWVLLLPAAPRLSREDSALRGWFVASVAAAVGSLLVSAAHVKWWGGWSLGPRLSTEAAPFLALAAVPLVRASRPALRATFLALLAFAAVTQFLLAYSGAAWRWDPEVLEPLGPRALWRWKDGQLAAAWGARLPSGRAVPATTPGSDDLGCSIDLPPEGAKVKGRLNVEGWARIPGADLDVTIYLDGIARAPLSSTRRDRSDVCEALPALGDCSSAGYVVVFEFQPGDAGPHEIHAVVRAPDGRARRYGVRSFVWSKD